MKRQPRILAGTALGLLMASAPLGAFPLQGSVASGLAQRTAAPFILAQAACAEGEAAEACAQKQQAEPEQKRERKKAEPEQQAAPAQSEQPAEEQQPRRKKRDQQQQTEQAPAEQAAPAEEQQPRRKKRDQQQQTEQAPAEQAAPAEEQQPRRKKRDQQQTEQAPAGQAEPANDNQPGEQAKPRKKNRQDQQAQPEVAPAPKEAPAGEATAPAGEQPAAQGEQPQDTTKKRVRKPVGEQPATAEQPATGEQPANGQTAAPVQGESPVQGEAPADPNAAPILDSQKDAERRGGRKQGDKIVPQDGEQQNGGQNAQQGGDQGRKPVAAPIDQGPPPTDDRAAQQEIKPEKIAPVTEEKGTRVERAPDENVRDRRRPKGVDVVRELGDRVILQFNNQTFVESNDAPRMTRGARNVYYEDLSGNRTREIVERDNGVQIVTIRNRYGDVIQRSRIAPDGREYVLSYVDERHYEDDSDWRDPGDDLPPMRLTIPREEYILDSEDVEDPDDYYTFLEQPPVEKVQRLYSIDEVKRSARVRDIARRVDLDTLNFEFGSASISDTEVQKLEGVATAMEKLLKKNPAETFLIEGHTDAVGSPEANLALSDRRAESVAEALTNAFGIPPENLTTQGYGEEYLKVNTSAPNRENRRVGIRRITSLVAPVASNN
ncbi:OmpA family protein [Mesorhizobium sp. M0011]|uniref:OmpA family protein n=1 Tax=Mesorhizobium sp. M0011 TaxID=2956839 RepID=UPI0033376449